MLDFSRVQHYYIACGYTDVRKQIDSLAALVQTQFGREMDETLLYLFCGRRAAWIKALYWDGTEYPAVQAPDRKAVPMVTEWVRSETDHTTEVPLAHGGTVHYPDEGVCSGKIPTCLLKSR